MKERTIRVVALALLCLRATVARAEGADDVTRLAARNLGTSGVEAYQAQDYATTSEKLEKAYRALRVPSLGLWSARALGKLGKLIEAGERYRETTRLDVDSGERAVQEQARADAATELEQLSPQIPNVIVKIVGSDPEQTTITIDGVPLSTALLGEKRPANPGKHQIKASYGDQSASGELQLVAGQTKTLTLHFGAAATGQATGTTEESTAPPSSAPPSTAPAVDNATAKSGSTRRTLGFVTIAVGGAGLVLGGVTGGLALSKKSSIDDNPRCAGNKCAPSEASLVSSYQTLRTLSTVGFVAGAVVLAGGVVLLVTAPKSGEQTALVINPGQIILSRSF